MPIVEVPKWTPGGPLDDLGELISLNLDHQQEEALKDDSKPEEYLDVLEELSSKYPSSPLISSRLASAHLELEDFRGGLELFEKTLELLGKQGRVDAGLTEFVEQLRKCIEEITVEEGKQWHQQLEDFVPPRSVMTYSFPSEVHDKEVRTAWRQLLEVKPQNVMMKYEYLLFDAQGFDEGFELSNDALVKNIQSGLLATAAERTLKTANPASSQAMTLWDFLSATDILWVMFDASPEDLVGFICELHRRIMKHSRISEHTVLRQQAKHLISIGIYRRRTIHVKLPKLDMVLQFPKWQDVPKDMNHFAYLFKECLMSDVSPFIKAAWIHTSFINIHPFEDGNGRTARILSSIPLVKAGLPFIIIRPGFRQKYVEAAFVARNDMNLNPLTQVFLDSAKDFTWFISDA